MASVLISLEWFSVDSPWIESTPHSGGYYHVSASYWANGLQNTLNANLSGLPNWTYAADGEGRWNGRKGRPGVSLRSSY